MLKFVDDYFFSIVCGIAAIALLSFLTGSAGLFWFGMFLALVLAVVQARNAMDAAFRD